MRGPLLFAVLFVAAAAAGAMLARPAPADGPGAAPPSLGALFLGARGEDGTREFPVERADALPLSVAACPAAEPCLNVVGQWRRDVPLAPTDRLHQARLDVSWSANGPATTRLTVTLVVCDVEEGCPPGASPLAVASGASPLRLEDELEPGEADPRGVLVLRVSPEDRVPLGPAAYVTPAAQPFTVTGEVEYHEARD